MSAAGRSLGTNDSFAMIAAVKVLAATGESAAQAVSKLLGFDMRVEGLLPQPIFLLWIQEKGSTSGPPLLARNPLILIPAVPGYPPSDTTEPECGN